MPDPEKPTQPTQEPQSAVNTDDVAKNFDITKNFEAIAEKTANNVFTNLLAKLLGNKESEGKQDKKTETTAIETKSDLKTQKKLFELEQKSIELEKKNFELQKQLETYELEREKTQQAEKALEEKRFAEKIDSEIKTMIEKGAIATGDDEAVSNWKNLFVSNFDNTKLLADKQIKSIDNAKQEASNANAKSQQDMQLEALRQKAVGAFVDWTKTKKWDPSITTN